MVLRFRKSTEGGTEFAEFFAQDDNKTGFIYDCSISPHMTELHARSPDIQLHLWMCTGLSKVISGYGITFYVITTGLNIQICMVPTYEDHLNVTCPEE